MKTKISAKAPKPFMNSLVAPYFESLRQEVLQTSGVDFLSVCGDVFREAGFKTSKVGVAYRSNHKTGRAFDYDQNNNSILVVREDSSGKTYFRTYLKCVPQDGSKGVKRSIKDKRGFIFNGYVVDFTDLAQKHGFVRIPAWSGWQSNYNKQEFWHYQKMDGLNWDEAMRQIKDNPNVPTNPTIRIWGFNDRGEEVKKIQLQLSKLGFLPLTEADGIFGQKTRKAVIAFQKKHNLSADGLVGADTRAKLFA